MIKDQQVRSTTRTVERAAPKRADVCIPLGVELYEQVARHAAGEGQTMAGFTRALLRKHFAKS